MANFLRKFDQNEGIINQIRSKIHSKIQLKIFKFTQNQTEVVEDARLVQNYLKMRMLCSHEQLLRFAFDSDEAIEVFPHPQIQNNNLGQI
jgi:hypothetical protein